MGNKMVLVPPRCVRDSDPSGSGFGGGRFPKMGWVGHVRGSFEVLLGTQPNCDAQVIWHPNGGGVWQRH